MNGVTFGKNLLLLRTRCGMTQEDLASELHVQRQTISNWELGKGKPDIYVLYDICKLFDITADEVLTGNRPLQEAKNVNVLEERLNALEFHVENMKEKGFYSILEEDIHDFFSIVYIDFERIMVIALTLKEKGYNIVDVFRNGFSIYLESADMVKSFKKDLDDILEGFLHGDEKIFERLSEIECITGKAISEVLDNVMDELYADHNGKLLYYWIDDLENIRGYGCTKEECVHQANMQGCEQFEVLQRI